MRKFTALYGIFVAKICKYGIFVAEICKYALIDRFQGSPGSLDSAANCAALMDGKKQFSNSGWQATQCCLGQSESQIKSWSNCQPKMVGTNHLSVEDVQIDKACVFQQKIIKLWSFNHSSQIKPKNFPEPKTLVCRIYDFEEISEILRGWTRRRNLSKLCFEGIKRANNRRGKRSKSQKVGAAAAAADSHTALWLQELLWS